MKWTKGQAATLTASYFAPAGTPADAGSVTLRVLRPDGTEEDHATPALSHSATGVYGFQQTLDQSGAWTFRFEMAGPGSYVGAQEYGLTVEESDFP